MQARLTVKACNPASSFIKPRLATDAKRFLRLKATVPSGTRTCHQPGPRSCQIFESFHSPQKQINYHQTSKRYLRLAPTKISGSPPYNDLTYYTWGTPNGLKPAIVLEELGLKYKCEAVNIMKNTNKEPWYLEINPNGRIPALTDGSMRVFESAAIMLYLAETYDPDLTLTYKHGSPEYWEMSESNHLLLHISYCLNA